VDGVFLGVFREEELGEGVVTQPPKAWRYTVQMQQTNRSKNVEQEEQENTERDVSLTLKWTLLGCPNIDLNIVNDETGEVQVENMSDKIGQHAYEYCDGTFCVRTGVLAFHGKSVSPGGERLIGVDAYRLQLSEDGCTLKGSSRGNAQDWSSSMELSNVQ
jgi:hypothetical protein